MDGTSWQVGKQFCVKVFTNLDCAAAGIPRGENGGANVWNAVFAFVCMAGV